MGYILYIIPYHTIKSHIKYNYNQMCISDTLFYLSLIFSSIFFQFLPLIKIIDF